MATTTVFSKANSTASNSVELNEDQLALFDVESPFGIIDHIIITRQNGVFLILKKAYVGKISRTNDQLRIDGKPPEKDFIQEVLLDTYWFEQKLLHKLDVRIQATPIVAFTHSDVPPEVQIKGVPVVSFRDLADILNHNKLGILTDEKLWENREKLLVLSREVKNNRVLMTVTD